MLRPEHRLLLACLREQHHYEGALRIEALVASEFDWDYLLRFARHHHVLLPLYRSLTLASSSLVPPPVVARLRHCFLANARHNLLIAAELVRILTVLRARGIPAVPFKGPLLAMSAYGNLALREFSDLDLFVRTEHLDEVTLVLRSFGYQLSARDATANRRFKYHHEFKRADGAFSLELHWRLVPGVPFDYGAMLERLEPLPLLGPVAVPSFAPGDTFLVVFAHGGKHLWGRLEWIDDVARLLERQRDIDWSQLLASAEALRIRRMMLVGLALARDLLAARLPPALEKAIADEPRLEALLGLIVDRLLAAPDPMVARDVWPRTRLRLALRDRMWDEVPLLLAPSIDEGRIVWLPSPLFPVYYLLRPLRVFLKYGRTRLQDAATRH